MNRYKHETIEKNLGRYGDRSPCQGVVLLHAEDLSTALGIDEAFKREK